MPSKSDGAGSGSLRSRAQFPVDGGPTCRPPPSMRPPKERVTRTVTRAVALTSLCVGLCACFGGPAWIHSLPKRSPADFRIAELSGTYVRTVESRYSAGNRAVGWQGREWLELGNGKPNAYVKVHLYVEQSGTRVRQIVYRETGTIEIGAQWVLLTPAYAGLYRREGTADAAHVVPLPNAADVRLQPVTPGPLVYFYNARELSLTPAAFERFGKVFEHGIHEGCGQPYETLSPPFRAAALQYNHKVFHRHGYFRVRDNDTQAPRNRNVLLPIRSTSPS